MAFKKGLGGGGGLNVLPFSLLFKASFISFFIKGAVLSLIFVFSLSDMVLVFRVRKSTILPSVQRLKGAALCLKPSREAL